MATLLNKFKQQKRGAENSLPSFDNGGVTWDKMKVPERRDYIVNFLKKKGLGDIQVYAIIGNLEQENSSFDTKLTNSIGATGIAQWYDVRARELKKRKNHQHIDVQLEHLWDEIQGKGNHWTNHMGGKNAFLNAKDLPTAVKIFRKDFERPGEHEAHDSKRLNYAVKASKGKINLPEDFKISDNEEYDPSYENAVFNQYENMAKAYSILAGAQVSAEDIEKRMKAENGLAGIQAELMVMEKAKEHQKEVAEANKLAEEALKKEEQEKANKKAQEEQAIITAMEQQQKEREFHANAYLGTMKQDVKIDPAVFSSGGGEQQLFRFNTQFNLQNAQKGGVIQQAFEKPNLLKFKNKYLNKYQVGGIINSTNTVQGNSSKEIEEEYELKENTPEIYKEFPIYKTAEDFYKKNKDLKTYKPSYENGKLKYKVENLYVGEDGAYSLNRIKENITDEGGNVLAYKDQCLSSACRAIDGLHSSGTSYTQSSDETKKLLGFGSSTNSAPTEEEKLQRPEFIDDDNFGSVDSWDLAFVANKNSPKNVLFDATKGQRELDVKDFEDNMISFNDAMKKYKIPFGTFITLGTRYKSDDSTKALGAVHTVRVTGYLEDGEPIVSDSESIKPLSEAFRIWGDREGKTIASIITVPGKEKYTFDYFQNAINKSKTKSNEKYVDYNSKMPLVNDEGEIEYVKPSKDYKKYAKVISENKNYITSLLDISDEEYDKYAKIALSIPALETQYGKGMMYGISRIDRDIFDGDSKGVSQLVGENVKPKYEKILSKYKDGTPENDALSTILYLKELDGYSKQWMEDSFFETERPYRLQENSAEGLLKDAIRPLQGRVKSGFYSNKTSGYTFKVDDIDVNIDSINKLRGETEEEYINRINKEIKDKGLRLDMEDRGGKMKPVIYKKTYGNSIPNDLSHTVGYLWQSPNAIKYGDAQGQSKYYKNFRKVYEKLFEKDK